MVLIMLIHLTSNKQLKVKQVTMAQKNVETAVPLKYLSNFLKTLELPLIKCEINFILTWSANCLMLSGNKSKQAATFTITDTKRYVTVITLSGEDNVKLLQQLKSGFKRAIN